MKDINSRRFMFVFMGTIFSIPIGFFLSILIYAFLVPTEYLQIGISVPLTFIGTLVVIGELWMLKNLWIGCFKNDNF